ncbi:antibiotic biosynthesis monooxygenase [Mycobacterium sp. BK558]|uniref:Antibiotic biosynthesis monooxygenase n=2 Tax=Mycolicibacterium chlorophenolicum TaxID=37916 RepID=A0A0J6VW67_9MYCO|nr:Antibiotic biosynthesis monooxygenase [Mycolicibacterium chlorophenolicum]RZT15856.1 antibiotic biosynthesis monooxygenase [Mycobacterium sp. BK558]
MGEPASAQMIIVAGHLMVDPADRESYLAGCATVVRQARAAPGCRDFAICADPVDPGRINVYEQWESPAAVEEFRGSGPSDEQRGAIRSGSVSEYRITDARTLFG